MTEDFRNELVAALRARLAVIGDRELRARDPNSHLENLRAASEALSRLQTELPADAAPQLRHFLERCSYEKALAFLENAPG